MKNKLNYLLSLVLLTGFLQGCGEDDAVPDPLTYEEQLAIDVEIIDNHLAQNSITAEVDESGLRYVIVEAGTGANPALSNNVEVNYEGKLLSDGTVFDSGEAFNFPLNRLIKGWQIGLPKIKEGGSMVLYIPSGLGYGTQGSGSVIPPNANLIFDIDLLEVQ